MRSSEAETLALRLLARRDFTRAELNQKLRARNFSSDLVAEICDSLVEKGFLDDQRVATRLLSTALEADDMGSARLAQLLHKRKLSRSMVEETMANFHAHVDEVERATALAERFINAGLQRAAIERRLWQRGMPAHAVRAAVANVNLDKEDEEG
ncbi:MAG: RecX family transcriptional regulator [Peptococcaceae bacterium]|nr:RecX family transcriptional regulator [Peptococcaceae bacterium]